MKIVICGGHLTPALALIEELQKQPSNKVEIIFFGRKIATEGSKNNSAEYEMITKKNVKFVEITAGRLQRKFTIYTVPALIKIPIGFIQSFIYLLFHQPDVVVSFGSYVSTPTVFAAWLLGIDSIVHEQAVIPGFANKLNAIVAKKVFLTWPQSEQYFSNIKTEVIGNLTRKSLFIKTIKNKQLDTFAKRSKKIIFISGGNQGSHFLNKLALNLQGTLKDFSLIHQVGAINYKGDLDKAKSIKSPNYFAIDYVDPEDIGAVFSKSNIVIARSGANTVWDLAILAKCAIFIPLPIAAANEQYHNAKILEDAHCAILINQKDADINSIKEAIEKLEKNKSSFEKSAGGFAKTLKQDAAKKLIDYIYTQ